jgi:site-specific recombinase XerD
MNAPVLSLSSHLESFFRQHLAAQRQASPATVATYRDGLRLFLVFAAEQAGKPPSRLSIEDLDRDRVLSFLDHLEKERGNTARTRNARLAAIRSFFQHVAYRDPAAMEAATRILAIPGKRMTKRVLTYLREEELAALLAVPDRTVPSGRRDHALLLFMARTGARVSETIGVRPANLRLERPCQVLLRGKGAKERIVPLSDDLAGLLRALIHEEGQPLGGSSPIFLNVRGKALTRFGVLHILRRTIAVAAKVIPSLAQRAISPHTLRHTTAMHLLQAGVDLTTIRSWLGHVAVQTTNEYVEADVEMKRRALEKCHEPEVNPVRYRPTDEVLALLESL